MDCAQMQEKSCDQCVDSVGAFFLSESHAHHPTMVNTFSYVRIELHTHDAGGVVTRKDHELARGIDALLQ